MMQQQNGVKSHGVGQTELDGTVQENAAAFYVQLTDDEKAYLEEAYLEGPSQWEKLLNHNIHIADAFQQSPF